MRRRTAFHTRQCLSLRQSGCKPEQRVGGKGAKIREDCGMPGALSCIINDARLTMLPMTMCMSEQFLTASQPGGVTVILLGKEWADKEWLSWELIWGRRSPS